MGTVALIGAGLIGRSWAMVFSRAGWDVRLYDAGVGVAAGARDLIRKGLAEQKRHGLVADPEAALSRIQAVASVKDALHSASFVQESGPETQDAKLEIWRELDRLAPPDVILASSTSAIVASRFTQGLAGRARCLVAHPVNPPHLVPVVELCGAPWTSPDTIRRAREIFESVGQAPVSVNREVDGFILNRLQAVLLAEAFRLVGEGICTPQDLDITIREGLGCRWSFMGPFETIELNAPGGIPDYCIRYGATLTGLASGPRGPDVFGSANVAKIMTAWGRTPKAKEVGERTHWRDERLAALAAHKRTQKRFES